MTPFATVVSTVKPSSLKPLTSGKTGALLATYDGGLKAIIKPVKEKLSDGSTHQRGLPVNTLPYREVAYYRLAKLLSLDHIVPETVLTESAVNGIASAQLFVPAHHLSQLQPKLTDTHADGWPKLLATTALRVPRDQWRQLLALDVIAGVRDRHSNNIGILMTLKDKKAVYRLAAWDNAASFGTAFTRYHNVFHKHLFRTHLNFDDMWPVWDRVTLESLEVVLGPYLTPTEIGHAFMRMKFFQDFPYRLPWKVVSQGHDKPLDFPAYQSYFEPVVEHAQQLVDTRAALS